MAIDFLLVSKSYHKSLREMKNNTGTRMLLRRSIVVGYLDDKFLVKPGVSTRKILADLESRGIISTLSTIRKDIELYRLAYRYFNGEKESLLKRIGKEGDIAAKVTRYLIADGIDSWEQVISMSDHPEDGGKIFDQNGNMLFKSTDQLYLFIVKLLNLATEALRRTKDNLDKKNSEIKSLASEVKRLRQSEKSKTEELELLNAESEIAQQDNKILKYKLEECDEMLDLADLTIADLEDQVGSLKKMLDLFKGSKDVFLEIHQIIESFISGEGSSASDGSDMDPAGKSDNDPNICLPADCLIFGKPFLYSRGFNKTFGEIEKSEQLVVVRALEIFSQHGPSYHSLRSRKQFYSTEKLQEGEMKSRGGKFFRFTWEIKDDVIHITGLHKKKDIINR